MLLVQMEKHRDETLTSVRRRVSGRRPTGPAQWRGERLWSVGGRPSAARDLVWSPDVTVYVHDYHAANSDSQRATSDGRKDAARPI